MAGGKLTFAIAPHPIDELLRGDRNAEALAAADEAIAAEPQRAKFWRMRHHALSALGRHDEAIAAIDRALALLPAHRPFRRYRALSLRNAGHYAEAAQWTSDLLSEDPDDAELLGAACVAAFRLGEEEQAIRFGQHRLDRLAAEAAVACDPASKPLDPSTGSAMIVSFGLWGNRRQYCDGAIANARDLRAQLPGWSALFFLGADVPGSVRDALAAAGASLVDASRDHPDVPPMAWRFLVHDRPDAARYLVRDCDSRIGAREVSAVREWEASNYGFHLIRDHPFHFELMVGGLWGGHGRRGFVMADRLAAASASTSFGYGGDQHFLARSVWPLVRDDMLTHDSYYRLGDTRPVPGDAKGTDADHIGMGIVVPGICKAGPSG
jgi:tetratricopeptide (TPR) repeat protein